MHAKLPDWYYTETVISVPLTTTQQMLIEGIKRGVTRGTTKYHKQLNFQTYPLNDFRFNFGKEETHTLDLRYITTYNSTYHEHTQFCKPKSTFVKENIPHRLFNRIPKTPFLLDISSPNKFMDDEVAMICEDRRNIDFFRQMRNTHYELI